MPVFNTALPNARAVSSGDTVTLFAATDTVAATNNSVVIAPAVPGPIARGVITFTTHFASAPTAVVEIFGSNTAPTTAGPQGGIILYTSTNLQNDTYSDNSAYAFYWAQLPSQSAGGAVTVIAHIN